MDPREAAAAASIGRLLEAARRRSSDLAAELHPAWLQHGCRQLGLDASVATASPRRCSAALQALFELQWPTLDRFQFPAHRIAVLPRDDIRRVLAVVALHAQRERVRLCIGHGLRAALVDRVGEAVYARMLEAPPLRGGGPEPLSAAELDPERLAWDGLARLLEIGAWRSRRLLRWMQIAFAPRAGKKLPRPRSGGPQEILTCLPSYFPEHAWLFGLPMDRALSASTTD